MTAVTKTNTGLECICGGVGEETGYQALVGTLVGTPTNGIVSLFIAPSDLIESCSLRKEAAVKSGVTAADTSVVLARRQQGEQIEASQPHSSEMYDMYKPAESSDKAPR
ncbi:hypothetical protein EYF80_039337 [Liparis tanakae]|uniref:Uncharacterized protein n=1 Tax=Liparis tanakae TaxID=230148 RepID=A0A4Z2GAC8_9TELE|nr:hypothetical protein EYF80_039337 [Liparis tanakae]